MGLSSLRTRQSSFPIAGSEDDVFMSGTPLSSDKKINLSFFLYATRSKLIPRGTNFKNTHSRII